MHRAEKSLAAPKIMSFFMEKLCGCLKSVSLTGSRRVGKGGMRFLTQDQTLKGCLMRQQAPAETILAVVNFGESRPTFQSALVVFRSPRLTTSK